MKEKVREQARKPKILNLKNTLYVTPLEKNQFEITIQLQQQQRKATS